MTEDLKKNFFEEQIMSINGIGSTIDEAYNAYLYVMKHDTNPKTKKKFKKEELAKGYKKYMQKKLIEEKTYTPNRQPTLGVRDYFLQKLHLQDFSVARIQNKERDEYIFGKDFI